MGSVRENIEKNINVALSTNILRTSRRGISCPVSLDEYDETFCVLIYSATDTSDNNYSANYVM